MILKASKTVIALKQFSVPRTKQAPANLKDALYITVKRHVELMDPGNYRGKSDHIFFLKLSAVVAIRDQSRGSKTRQLSE